ncbi:MAG: hypothetical protein HZC02_00565 [Candidatus Levybacteria bacterium]|nr:hypothetical protein [Candidatus Levybacteria bacterium]
MRILKNKLIHVGILLIAVTLIAFHTHAIQKIFWPERVEAVGDLTINWGIGTGNVGPIFTLNDMAPGQSEQKTVSVSNGSLNPLTISVRGVKALETASLANVMNIAISHNGVDLYGGSSPTGFKTLADFFSDSSNILGISLKTQSPNTTENYQFTITFNESAGNTYQNASLSFDIHMGIAIDIPIACQSINFGTHEPIIGSKKSEKLTGTAQNDLILGMGGSDKIDGKGGHDCILGGDGSDSITGDTGDDVLVGEGGSDTIRAGSGNDTITGGNGADSMYGDADNDTIVGDGGSDKAVGGTGTDTCSAESKSQCEL